MKGQEVDNLRRFFTTFVSWGVCSGLDRDSWIVWGQVAKFCPISGGGTSQVQSSCVRQGAPLRRSGLAKKDFSLQHTIYYWCHQTFILCALGTPWGCQERKIVNPTHSPQLQSLLRKIVVNFQSALILQLQPAFNRHDGYLGWPPGANWSGKCALQMLDVAVAVCSIYMNLKPEKPRPGGGVTWLIIWNRKWKAVLLPICSRTELVIRDGFLLEWKEGVAIWQGSSHLPVVPLCEHDRITRYLDHLESCQLGEERTRCRPVCPAARGPGYCEGIRPNGVLNADWMQENLKVMAAAAFV